LPQLAPDTDATSTTRSTCILCQGTAHGRTAITEYEAQALATREKTARLRALRLAKEAQAQNEGAATRPTKGNKKRRTEIRRDK
jgi:hypothetical protein